MIDQLLIFCDGGARGNPGPAACAFVVKNQSGKILHQAGQYLGHATNNQAEYQAIILALEWLAKNQSTISHQPSAISFYLDSSLAVNQLTGRFKIKNQKLQQLVIQVKSLEEKIKSKIFCHFVRREKNKEADKLLNQILDARR